MKCLYNMHRVGNICAEPCIAYYWRTVSGFEASLKRKGVYLNLNIMFGFGKDTLSSQLSETSRLNSPSTAFDGISSEDRPRPAVIGGRTRLGPVCTRFKFTASLSCSLRRTAHRYSLCSQTLTFISLPTALPTISFVYSVRTVSESIAWGCHPRRCRRRFLRRI